MSYPGASGLLWASCLAVMDGCRMTTWVAFVTLCTARKLYEHLSFLIKEKKKGVGGRQREKASWNFCEALIGSPAKHQFSTEGLLLTHSKHCVVQKKGTPEGV